MSWESETTKPSDMEAWLRKQFTGPNSTVLALELASEEAYAAVEERRSDGSVAVEGVVILLRFPRGRKETGFDYRILPEDAGPFADTCPKYVLDLLTPTDDDLAQDWRARCRHNLRFPKGSLKLGDIIRLEEAIVVRQYDPQDTFRVIEVGTVGRQDLFEALSTETGEALFTCRIPKYDRGNLVLITEDEIMKPADTDNSGPKM